MRSRHIEAERHLVPLGILERWNDHQGRAEQLEQLLEALGTWTRWARGDDVSSEQLRDSAVTVDTHARTSNQINVRHVAEAVRLWAVNAGVEWTHPSTIEHHRPAVLRHSGPDLGLGR
ncbi:MAG: hypothetical protein H0W53_21580, partial [Acidobacteria bacterium]|nr:hypothetical protein [Acidobacteriota bacterium]